MSTFWGAQVAMNFIQDEGLAPMAVKKIKIQGAVLELPAEQHCQLSVNGPIWQLCLAGSSKLALRILTFHVNCIATC